MTAEDKGRANARPIGAPATTRCTEASDLGWGPGVWPESVDHYENGVGARFTRDYYQYDGDGDLLYVVYQADAVTLRVYND